MTSMTFIGAGNMASSMIGGLISQGYQPGNITASDPNTDALSRLKAQFGINTTQHNLDACDKADIIVLSVKPQMLKAVAQAIAPALSHQPLVISIAAGIHSQALNQWLGAGQSIVRCMPNTPALIQQGATGLYANEFVSTAQKTQTEQLIRAIGAFIWVDNEALIDAVTAISGSGPAYFFLMVEAMIDSGIKQGLTSEQAQQLALQTAKGAALLAENSNLSVDALRRNVTSPGGTTEQAILSFEKADFRQTVDDAMIACAERSKQMALEFS